jgi:hypothetical protein
MLLWKFAGSLGCKLYRTPNATIFQHHENMTISSKLIIATDCSGSGAGEVVPLQRGNLSIQIIT